MPHLPINTITSIVAIFPGNPNQPVISCYPPRWPTVSVKAHNETHTIYPNHYRPPDSSQNHNNNNNHNNVYGAIIMTSLWQSSHGSPMNADWAPCGRQPPNQANRLGLWVHRTHTHPFNGPLSGTTRVSQYQKGKTNLDFTEARDSEWQWLQLGHMQVCTLLQTDTTPAPHRSVFYRPDALPAAQPTASKHWVHRTLAAIIHIHLTTVIITQLVGWYSFYRPTKGGRLSLPKHCSNGAQPVPTAVYCSSCCDKHNCLRHDLNLGPLTPQLDMLTTRPLHLTPSVMPISNDSTNILHTKLKVDGKCPTRTDGWTTWKHNTSNCIYYMGKGMMNRRKQ